MREITGQVIYLGPQLQHIGLAYGTIFKDGIYKHLYDTIAQCPAIGELFIPIAQVAEVRRELNFDLGRQLRGTQGRHVTFYREVQNWLANLKQNKPHSAGVQLEHHNA